MGIHMSFLRKSDWPMKQLHCTEEIYNEFFDPNMITFSDFHIAFLDFFMKLNSALPGRHYRIPSMECLEEFYKDWDVPNKDIMERKKMVIELVEKYATVIKTDNNALMMTGLIVPAAAMILKRAIPDTIFVSSCTLLALAASKAIQIHVVKKII